MFSQQTALATSSRGRYKAFGALGQVTSSVSALQAALNSAYSPSGTVLAVDGVFGSRTRARLIEYQAFIGLTPNGDKNDYATLVSLGLPAGGIEGGGSSDAGSYSWSDFLTLKPLRDAVSTSTPTSRPVQTPAPMPEPSLVLAPQQDMQLQALAAQGDLAAKLALTLNVSRATAQTIMLGGGAVAVLALLGVLRSKR